MKTIVWAGKVLPYAESATLENQAVLVEGNKILELGDAGDLTARFPEAKRIGGQEYLMLPALINSHDHGRVLGTSPMGIPDDMLEVWIVRQRSQPVLDPYLSALYSGICLLQSGVGTVVHLHTVRDWQRVQTEAEATIRGYRDAGIRVVFCLQYSDQNPLVYQNYEKFIAELDPDILKAIPNLAMKQAIRHEEYIDLTHSLIDLYDSGDEHTVEIAYCAAGGQWSSDELLVKLTQAAIKHQRRIQMHALETKYQSMNAHRRWDKSIIQHLEDIGVLGPWMTLAHMVWIEPNDLEILADHGVGVAHNPSSNLRLRSGIAPVDQMLRKGIPVGVGLDGFALDDDQDYLRELRLAWFLSNKPGVKSPRISAAEILKLGTETAGQVSFGPQTKIGKLEFGFLADLALLDYRSMQGVWSSSHVPLTEMLLHRGSRQHVRHLMVNGAWVIQDGNASRVNFKEVKAELRQELSKLFSERDYEAKYEASKQLSEKIRQYYIGWEEFL